MNPVGEPITVANEFTEVVIQRVDTPVNANAGRVGPEHGSWRTNPR
jgi:hypothetical protein